MKKKKSLVLYFKIKCKLHILNLVYCHFGKLRSFDVTFSFLRRPFGLGEGGFDTFAIAISPS